MKKSQSLDSLIQEHAKLRKLDETLSAQASHIQSKASQQISEINDKREDLESKIESLQIRAETLAESKGVCLSFD